MICLIICIIMISLHLFNPSMSHGKVWMPIKLLMAGTIMQISFIRLNSCFAPKPLSPCQTNSKESTRAHSSMRNSSGASLNRTTSSSSSATIRKKASWPVGRLTRSKATRQCSSLTRTTTAPCCFWMKSMPPKWRKNEENRTIGALKKKLRLKK